MSNLATLRNEHVAHSSLQSANPAAQRQIDALQSLRGIAAIVVLMRHLLSCFPLPWPRLELPLNLLFNSHAAVVVFFVLSGFVLAPSFWGKSIELPLIAGFYIRRAFRILPVLMVVTLLSWLYVLMPFSAISVPGANLWFEGLLPHGTHVGLKDMVKCLLGLQSTLVPQNWTIMVEMLVALVLPVFVAICEQGRIRALVLAALCIAISFAAIRFAGKGLPGVYAVDFVFGVIAYSFFREGRGRPAGWMLVLALIALVSIRYVLSDLTHIDVLIFHHALFGLAEGLAASVVVLGLAAGGRIARALSWRPLVWLGDLSFGVYLVHFLVIVIIARCEAGFLGGLSAWEQTLAVGVPVLLISTVMAYGLHITLEMPINDLGRRFAGIVRRALETTGSKAR